MSLDLKNTVIEILKANPEKYFTARELAEEISQLKPDECQEKMERSKATIIPIKTKEALLNQLVAEIGSRKKNILSETVKTTAERPRKYYYSEKTDAQEIEKIEQPKNKNQQPEHELYPILCQFLYDELDIYPKRIDEKKSSNTQGPEGNIWLYPDIVGVKNLATNWSQDIKNCVNKHAYNQTSLWSFEVKIVLNRSNIRKSFFQAVSNSTWANYSYLVAESIDEKAEDELRLLCKAYNIGVITLNKNIPSESQILIPAIEREKLDWDMMNRIALENSDFKEFISLITEFYQTGKIKERDWDISKSS